ncbi:class I SAM-dependent methyltransferase [Emticicia sp. CRIBPO]|uniref:class I SAM-dependent methyltransferase n=1 Tax=Emticicia sp. CRIBPO TaxID=2683258 RepID=UPI001412F676|nr:class I SAM-dependent methyltransferase [Emticicia sp. CRIBPO]NBA87109.1 class I SAM-dependent methyltransferase [Emticicia sp. CRIBPO]
MKSRIKLLAFPVIDILIAPFVLISGYLFLWIRKIGFNRLKVSKNILLKVGVIPIRDHYYEPLFDKKHLTKPLSDDRYLPGIDWNIDEQIEILEGFHYNDEIVKIPINYVDDQTFHFDNPSFKSGDAEYWYNIIRSKKPSKIIEIGSGHSTKMAQLAIKKNKEENEAYTCEHICIEPYEMPWLEKLGIKVIRDKVENVDKEIFKTLGHNDILFIDSSHMIRPQGDVLFEFLELLPDLPSGVIVHVHDIFSPKDYLEDWVLNHILFWNEQYLLEAFLTHNSHYRIIGSLNFLKHNYSENLKSKCPFLTPEREPGSFYMVKQ